MMLAHLVQQVRWLEVNVHLVLKLRAQKLGTLEVEDLEMDALNVGDLEVKALKKKAQEVKYLKLKVLEVAHPQVWVEYLTCDLVE